MDPSAKHIIVSRGLGGRVEATHLWFLAQVVLARRASALRALGRYTQALGDTEHALAMWQHLAPAGHLHQVELLDALAAIQTRPGNHRAAREAARHAIALVRDRNLIDPALLTRIDAVAGPAR